MRLFNAAGAAHHGGYAGLLKQTGFGAKGHQRGALCAGQALRQPRHRLIGRAQKGRHLAQRFKAEAGLGCYLFHSWLRPLCIG